MHRAPEATYALVDQCGECNRLHLSSEDCPCAHADEQSHTTTNPDTESESDST